MEIDFPISKSELAGLLRQNKFHPEVRNINNNNNNYSNEDMYDDETINKVLRWIGVTRKRNGGAVRFLSYYDCEDQLNARIESVSKNNGNSVNIGGNNNNNSVLEEILEQDFDLDLPDAGNGDLQDAGNGDENENNENDAMDVSYLQDDDVEDDTNGENIVQNDDTTNMDGGDNAEDDTNGQNGLQNDDTTDMDGGDNAD